MNEENVLKESNPKSPSIPNYGSIAINVNKNKQNESPTSSPSRSNIIDHVEDEIKKQGSGPNFSPILALSKTLRANIETSIKKLENSATNLVRIDWIIFIFVAACMAIVAMGINFSITNNLNLVQMLAALSLSIKGVEKSLNLSGIAKDKELQVKELKKLLRRAGDIELSFYFNTDNVDIKQTNLDIKDIWNKFSEIETKTLIAPPQLSDNSEPPK